MRSLTDEDIDALCKRLVEFSGLSPEEHMEHHAAFSEYIASQRRKAEFYEKVKEQVGGWMVISILASVGYAAWHGFVWAIARGH